MNSAIRVGLITVLAFFGGLGSWAALAPLDGAVVGTGALAVHGTRQTIQHREGGIVAELLVRDGTLVEEGQLLVRLDDTQARASYTVHHAQLMADRALVARSLAELAEATEVTFPPVLDDADPVALVVKERERLMFTSRRDLLFRQIAILDQRIEQSRQ